MTELFNKRHTGRTRVLRTFILQYEELNGSFCETQLYSTIWPHQLRILPAWWFLEVIYHFVQHACMRQVTASRSPLFCIVFFAHVLMRMDETIGKIRKLGFTIFAWKKPKKGTKKKTERQFTENLEIGINGSIDTIMASSCFYWQCFG